eukprot:6203914-Alexandrium_andersonii.AAC.1
MTAVVGAARPELLHHVALSACPAILACLAHPAPLAVLGKTFRHAPVCSEARAVRLTGCNVM